MIVGILFLAISSHGSDLHRLAFLVHERDWYEINIVAKNNFSNRINYRIKHVWMSESMVLSSRHIA